MGRDWAEWWSKGGCVGRRSNWGFFGRISGPSSCLSTGPLLPIAGIAIAARQVKRTFREAGDCLAEGRLCRVSAGAPDTRVPPWERAGRGLACQVAKVGPLSLGCLFCSHQWTAMTWAAGKLPPWRVSHRGVVLLDPADASCSPLALPPAASFKGNTTALRK